MLCFFQRFSATMGVSRKKENFSSPGTALLSHLTSPPPYEITDFPPLFHGHFFFLKGSCRSHITILPRFLRHKMSRFLILVEHFFFFLGGFPANSLTRTVSSYPNALTLNFISPDSALCFPFVNDSLALVVPLPSLRLPLAGFPAWVIDPKSYFPLSFFFDAFLYSCSQPLERGPLEIAGFFTLYGAERKVVRFLASSFPLRHIYLG